MVVKSYAVTGYSIEEIIKKSIYIYTYIYSCNKMHEINNK
jgi:hypothetical protein